MKKTLLFLAAAAVGLCASAAEPIVADFNAEAWKDYVKVYDKNAARIEYSATVDGVEYNFNGSYISAGYNEAPNYLMMRAKDYKEPRAFFTVKLPMACSKIVLTTNNGSISSNPNSQINIMVGETAIKEGLAVNVAGAENTVMIPANLQAAGTVYTFQSNTTSYNQQFSKITFYPVTAEPSLNADVNELSYAVALNGTQAHTVKVVAANITGDITAASSTADFTLAKTSFTQEEAAAGVEITLNGTTAGEKTGKITFTAGSATVEVAVSGVVAANAGTEVQPLTVDDVLAMKSLNDGEFYVTGTIGDLTAANAQNGMVGTVADAEKNAATNIVLKNGEKMIGVKLPSGDIRTKLNIVDTPDNAGKTIVIKGKLLNYFGAPGVDCTEYVSGLAGIADVTVEEEGVAEYYNLQGVRMQGELTPGMYIVRNGKNVSKVVVK